MNSVVNRDSVKFENYVETRIEDNVIKESAIQISLNHGNNELLNIGVIMRTPGRDNELIMGFLFCEGIITSILDIDEININDNIAIVHVNKNVEINKNIHERMNTVTSSCGICGRSGINDLLHFHGPKLSEEIKINMGQINKSLVLMRSKQAMFTSTGGSHACASFSDKGDLIDIQEDIGRHNAMDKLIGNMLICETNKLKNEYVVVSGRASFELVFKSIKAGFPILISVGAPSSLAIDVAIEHGLTLCSFAKKNKMTIYSGMRRIMKI